MASRDASEYKDHIPSISNVVVPAALLRTTSNDLFSRSRRNTQENAQPEDFDVQNVINTNICLALSRASTIDIAGLQRNRQIGSRSAANGLGTINQAEALSRPVLIEMPPPARLRRSGSLDTSQLHRGQVDRNTVSRRSWVPAPVISEEPPSISEDPACYDPATPAPAMTIVDGNSSYIFQDLSTFRSLQRQDGALLSFPQTMTQHASASRMVQTCANLSQRGYWSVQPQNKVFYAGQVLRSQVL
jgi:hypothetical protein